MAVINGEELDVDPVGWQWLWNRLLAPLSAESDAGIVGQKSNHLRLVKPADEIHADEE